ncbi:MAG: hypothetical protein HUU50_09600 [Candidatus Brocadiae bacterium]|nr:hypothetical protein [Candidatus Brocadiia bacterium]
MLNNEEKDTIEKLSFFDEKRIKEDPNFLSKLFIGYGHFFHETVWLYRQKFFTRLCLSYCDDSQGKKINKALEEQKLAWQNKKQLHLGEILLQDNILGIQELTWLCEEAGQKILFCHHCKEHFHISVWLPGKSTPCPKCNNSLKTEPFSAETLLQMLRSNFCSPRVLPDSFSRGNSGFVLLNLSDYIDMDMIKLDREIQTVFEFLDHWIVSTLPLDGKKKELSEKIHQERISQLSLFFGHIYNLYEIFWLLNQKMIQKLSLASHLLTPIQNFRTHSAQKKLLSVDQQCHWGDILLHTQWLNEKQIYPLLQKIGNRLLSCKNCKSMFWEFMKKDAACFCQNCLNPLEEGSPTSSTLRQGLRMLFSQPIPLDASSQASMNLFSFFAQSIQYQPIFSLSPEENLQALDAFLFREELKGISSKERNPMDLIRKFRERKLQELPKDSCPMELAKNEANIACKEIVAKEKQGEKACKDTASIFGKDYDWQEFMDSLDKMDAQTPEEEIYRQYSKEKEKYQKAITTSMSKPPEKEQDQPKEKPQQKEIPKDQGKEQPQQKEKKELPKKTIVHTKIPASKTVPKAKKQWSRQNKIGISFFLCIIIGCFLYFLIQGILASSENNKKVAVEEKKEVKQNTPSPDKQEIPLENVPKKEQETSPVQPEEKDTALSQFIAQGGHSFPKILQKIKQLEQSKELKSKDVAFLNKIYQNHVNDEPLCLFIVQAIGTIQGEKATLWLEEVAMQTARDTERLEAIKSLGKFQDEQRVQSLEKIFQMEISDAPLCHNIIDALGKMGGERACLFLEQIVLEAPRETDRVEAIKSLGKIADERAVKILYRIFQKESSGRLCSNVVEVLSKLFPQDLDLYQKITAKFTQTNEDSTQISILQSLCNMKIDDLASFFMEIASQKRYKVFVRLEAIQGITKTIQHSKNSDLIGNQLKELSSTSEGELSKKSAEAAKILKAEK